MSVWMLGVAGAASVCQLAIGERAQEGQYLTKLKASDVTGLFFFWNIGHTGCKL
jgi:hypothetical protein